MIARVSEVIASVLLSVCCGVVARLLVDGLYGVYIYNIHHIHPRDLNIVVS